MASPLPRDKYTTASPEQRKPARGASGRPWARKAAVGLSVVALAAAATPHASAATGDRGAEAAELQVLSYNTILFSKLVYPHLGQDHRAQEIPKADFFQGNDVVVLQELYSNGPADKLMQGATAQYPHQTPVLGRSGGDWDATGGASRPLALENGGVAVLSKWPITRQEQYVYKDGCGVDGLAKKGFVYTELDVNGTPVHIVGTHAQSDDSLCGDGQPAEVRAKQFAELDAYLDAKGIPAGQQVLVAGDFNVDSGTAEYTSMLSTAGLQDADRTGHRYSFDTQENSIAHDRGADKPPRDLDYVLYRDGHPQPEGWTNEVYKEQSAPWTAPDGKEYTNLSDHYPVFGAAG